MAKPVYIGVDAIMSAVETFLPAAPFVSLWNGQMLMAQFNKKGLVEDQLRSILDMAKENGNTDVYYLKFHPELTNGYVTIKTPVVTTLPVQVITRAETVGGNREWLPATQYAQAQQGSMIGAIEKMINPINERLAALEKVEPVGKEDEVDKWLERLNHPAIGGILTVLLQKFLPGLAIPAAPQNLAISGVPGELENWDEGMTEEQIGLVNTSLDELKISGMAVDTDLAKLSAMSRENPTLFNMLLGQLRSQK